MLGVEIQPDSSRVLLHQEGDTFEVVQALGEGHVHVSYYEVRYGAVFA